MIGLYVGKLALESTFGAATSLVMLLIWVYYTSQIVLLGAEFNAELQRGRRIEAGFPPDREPFVEPRDTRRMKQPHVQP